MVFHIARYTKDQKWVEKLKWRESKGDEISISTRLLQDLAAFEVYTWEEKCLSKTASRSDRHSTSVDGRIKFVICWQKNRVDGLLRREWCFNAKSCHDDWKKYSPDRPTILRNIPNSSHLVRPLATISQIGMCEKETAPALTSSFQKVYLILGIFVRMSYFSRILASCDGPSKYRRICWFLPVICRGS